MNHRIGGISHQCPFQMHKIVNVQNSELVHGILELLSEADISSREL